jgi:putative nucleotidyltransferase with HDIG domain
MRLNEARKIIAGKADEEDVAELLGAARGTLTAGRLREMMQGHHDLATVNPNHDGVGVWIADWPETKAFDTGNTNAIDDSEKSFDVILEELGDALERGAQTDTHEKKVTAFTVAIARAMGLPQEKIKMIARGAFLHDIGNMAIPDAILRKPGVLTPQETEIMREHCFRGYQMLSKIPLFQEIAEIVYSHQEHFDGAGYPRGLKGDQIPLGARIVAIADTLDAIISNRPYRAARSVSIACKEIEKAGGQQFDPEIVRTFLTMPQTIWEDLAASITSAQFNRG